MTQYDAVAKVMRERGGYATLATLYREAPSVPGSKWGTKTPHESIRRIVQTSPLFFRVRPGLWGLCESRTEILAQFRVEASDAPSSDPDAAFDHTYYQGLAVELGNYRGFATHVPVQDRNRRYLGAPLGGTSSLPEMPEFTYPHLTRRARMVDVVWINDRGFPAAFIEVEFTTGFDGALLKFCEFRDFRAELWIVLDKTRRDALRSRLEYSVFSPIRDLVRPVTYERLAELHSATAVITKTDGV